MRPPSLRAALPWLIAASPVASLGCLALAVALGFAARADAVGKAVHGLAGQADVLARQIDSDIALYDLTLRDAAGLLPPRDANSPAPNLRLLDLPLTAGYVWFINVLNESGDVVADPRSNVSRPANFAGRDYFQDHLKNPADILMIGRPFGIAGAHASIPISRRLSRPDGSFAGVVVAGVQLTWLRDLLSRPWPGPQATITVRRGHGMVLMRVPYDPEAIGRGSAADPDWQWFLRTGLSLDAGDRHAIHLFRRLGTADLVLELALDRSAIAAGERAWLLWLPMLALLPGLGILLLGLAARQLQRRNKGIEAASSFATVETMRLLANMSHELRSPLTGILGQAELITEEGGLTRQQTIRLARLTEAATLMRNIVNRVINVARPDDAGAAPVLLACDLDSLLETSLAMVEGEARRKGLLLTSNVEPTTPRRAMLEHDRVQQMLVNLLMNAVKFTALGTVALRVSTHAAYLRFVVADTGPGVPAGKRHRLFHRHDRLDLASAQAEGTGLGLSITERFATDMGGRVGHDENPGGGSVFWFELPFISPPAMDDAPPVTPPEAEPGNLRILLADDLELTRTVTADYLRSAGHLVSEVSNGEAAVAAVQDQDYDVVLTDMRMPVVDGLEVARRIRALSGHRGRTPVVLVTGDVVAIRAGESGLAGVDICLKKPFRRAELLAAVAAAARLAPVPDTEDDPVLDAAALNELWQMQGDAGFARFLDEATQRLATLLLLLERPDAPVNAQLHAEAHDLVGVAGMLGLGAFAADLQRFDLAADRAASAAALRVSADAALQALRRHRETVAVER